MNPRAVHTVTWHVEEALQVLRNPEATEQDLLVAASELAEALDSLLYVLADGSRV